MSSRNGKHVKLAQKGMALNPSLVRVGELAEARLRFRLSAVLHFGTQERCKTSLNTVLKCDAGWQSRGTRTFQIAATIGSLHSMEIPSAYAKQ